MREPSRETEVEEGGACRERRAAAVDEAEVAEEEEEDDDDAAAVVAAIGAKKVYSVQSGFGNVGATPAASMLLVALFLPPPPPLRVWPNRDRGFVRGVLQLKMERSNERSVSE